MIKAIIFDIGGVVLFPGDFNELRKEFAQILKTDVETLRPVFREWWVKWRLGKIKEDEFFEGLSKYFGCGDEEKKELRDYVYMIGSLNKPVLGLIARLKKNYKISAATNHAREWFEDNSKRFDFNRYFDIVVTSYEEGLAKPEEAFYKALLKKVGFAAEECVFIDNSKKNVEAAEKIGINVIFYEDYDSFVKSLKELGIDC